MQYNVFWLGIVDCGICIIKQTHSSQFVCIQIVYTWSWFYCWCFLRRRMSSCFSLLINKFSQSCELRAQENLWKIFEEFWKRQIFAPVRNWPTLESSATNWMELCRYIKSVTTQTQYGVQALTWARWTLTLWCKLWALWESHQCPMWLSLPV